MKDVSKIKCSKCGTDNLPVSFTETTSAITKRIVLVDGKYEDNNPTFKEVEVKAFCFCGHIWKVRGVKSISEITGIEFK